MTTFTAETPNSGRDIAASDLIDPAAYKLGMRRLAAGVSIVTTLHEGHRYGLVATSVTSVSASPRPSLLVCVDQKASAHDHLIEAGHLCVNILGRDDHPMADGFSTSDRSKRFASPRWRVLKTGSPSLGGALASFDCIVASFFSVQSHTIFVGEVVELRLGGEDVSPLIYADGHFGQLCTL